ncbi:MULTISPECIES: acyl-CoA dehydrogenase family protein [Bradyrhizobium]|uniref:Acyl-CoA dehydrogenase family protein n=1 Tax=Bradyrhizobium brasilense TaxID=1419277 RepID=A0ABY8JK19_9BRAD|nr:MULTISPECIES: acyl-CoA dehydrogenase family protein [Bradyrhizobium]MCP1912017.1 alkylation response protein AidB-like acyl-CoA dehydrogenase [Bradyrhizobium elkanii]MCP1829627.1 alkylation response protein AidB-like acyl-CoA dehydrogenase [Bradyrhizobium sp. USDA 4545]MCP1848231.1 alkylation response protein AidB-like acyl-CoA dehydrogenase [Bradyrhizobium sp. USDA 4541]MCP1922736.1 alkylation response protein AidB-like acyl-CoA dehydrogenase [Bradyrhizobium sp. USDA 4532]OMI04583.1 acyl-C
MNKPQGFDLVERARALAPLITSEADEIERTRRLTPSVTAALVENGLYRALLPKRFGGAEATLDAFMQMQEEIAKADASTAWCLGQCSVCAMTAAYLEPDAANEIFNTTPGILAWGAIAHEVRAEPGGYRASARWDFASGSRQASWLGAHVRVVEDDGSPRKKADGSPEIRTILFPMSSATMYDVWDVIGLKGTGTDSYSVDNLFIPEQFAALRDDPAACREPGPLYKLSTNMVFSMGFAATSLGVARAMLDAATELARGKTPQGLKAMRDNNAVQGQIGRTEASLRAARAYLYATAHEVWNDLVRGDPITEAHRVAIRIASTWTIHQSAAVVDIAYHMSGATAVFAKNPFERRFRDMHAIAQQIQARDTQYEDAGKAILAGNLGAPPTAR